MRLPPLTSNLTSVKIRQAVVAAGFYREATYLIDLDRIAVTNRLQA